MIRATEQDGRHPRPQLIRENWTSLDGTWSFAHDDHDRGLSERWFDPASAHVFTAEIVVPFAPESAASGIDDPGFHPVVWYRLEIEGLTGTALRRILHFGAVDRIGRVWVDGVFVGEHVGGQTAFSFDITDALSAGDRHVIVVRAFDDPADHESPRGKQDWRAEPHAIWYRRSTGIWRSVWMETVAPQHVSTVQWESDRTTGTVGAVVSLAGGGVVAGSLLRVTLTKDDQVLSVQTTEILDTRVELTFHLPALRNAQEREFYQWSPENPALVDALLEVVVDGQVIDESASYFGIRSTEVGRGWFLLNGLPYYVRSVLEQGYWTDSLFTAPDPESYRSEVELIKSLGFNAARIHQKVEDPRMLYWADRLGLLIWGETAAAYEYTPRAAAVLMAEWAAIVEQQRSHPSVVTWVPVNESWGVQDIATSRAQQQFVRAITSFTRALDPGRPVISNDGWEHIDSDILSIHDYTSDGATMAENYASHEAVSRILDSLGPQGRRPILEPMQREGFDRGDLPLMVTEFGGISYSDRDTWGYLVVNSDDEFRERVSALFEALRSSPVVTGFCYTQLTDTLQESNGLLTADREPKLPVEELRRIVTGTDEDTKVQPWM
ncbi:glycoside hydrolase family 2 protein [Diaminobutyricibacter sp. McL0618]|uniref:glycoside hydrolase family 2 protein n=1 Tax=Leifsonia sp. McL0618 TaxID=3415677 RepID=UPI003CF7160B